MKHSDVRDDKITIRIPSSLREALERAAEADHRTVSDLIVLRLMESVRRRTRKAA